MTDTPPTGKPLYVRNETERYTAQEAHDMLRAAIIHVLERYDEPIIIGQPFKNRWYWESHTLLGWLDGFEPITAENEKEVLADLARGMVDDTPEEQLTTLLWNKGAQHGN